MRTESIMIPVMRFVAERPWLSRRLFAGDPWGNPFDPELTADPFILVERMWADGPVTFKSRWGRWFVPGYEEAQTVLTHPAASAGADVAGLVDEVRPYKQLAPETKAFFQQWMLLRDGTDHAKVRRLVSRAFTPRRVAGLEALIETEVDTLLDRIAEPGARTRIELMESFARRLPVRIVGRLLGLPEDRWEWAGEQVGELATFLDPTGSFDVGRLDAAAAAFDRVLRPLIAERRQRPVDDLLSDLVASDDDGASLPDHEVVANAGFLVFAGHDTISGMLGNAVLALAEHPEQRALVAADPDLWPNAVEELLRWDPPVVAVLRRASAEIDLGHQVLPAGALLSLELGAANRDPRRWDDPWVLRLDRPDPRPLSFGFGAHHCLGHALARLELQIALRAIVERFGDFTVDRNEVEWRHSALLRGPTRLYLTPG